MTIENETMSKMQQRINELEDKLQYERNWFDEAEDKIKELEKQLDGSVIAQLKSEPSQTIKEYRYSKLQDTITKMAGWANFEYYCKKELPKVYDLEKQLELAGDEKNTELLELEKKYDKLLELNEQLIERIKELSKPIGHYGSGIVTDGGH